MQDPYTVATWRLQQIAPLLDPSLDEARRRVVLREICAKVVEWPGSASRKRRGKPPIKKRIPRSTIYRWLNQFRKYGLEGLKPRRRRYKPRKGNATAWVSFAIGLLYEIPSRPLSILETMLRAEFPDYKMSRVTLWRKLRAHPSFSGIEKLRGEKFTLCSRFEASFAHESWQLDGKVRIEVRYKNGEVEEIAILTILDDFSRDALDGLVAESENTLAAIVLFELVAMVWGLPERMQFDRGSAWDSDLFRTGLAILGVHRNFVKPRNPRAQGKIEAYHRCLQRWFIDELKTQEIIDREHLQQLLRAMLAMVYNKHYHREIKTTPEKKLAGKKSKRTVSYEDLVRAFYVSVEAMSDPKTGEVNLPTGKFVVPAAFAGKRCLFRYHPVHKDRAVLVVADGREKELKPFVKKSVSDIPAWVEKRGRGRLQKLYDTWRGREIPNSEIAFGIPEVFRELEALLGRPVPLDEEEAMRIHSFYREHGPLSRDGFLIASRRAKEDLGEGRTLMNYLDHIERQIEADNKKADPESPDQKGETT